jgi:hypothetical protein
MSRFRKFACALMKCGLSAEVAVAKSAEVLSDDRPLARVAELGRGNRSKRRLGWDLVKRPPCGHWMAGWDCECECGEPQWYYVPSVAFLQRVVKFGGEQ